MMIAEKQLKRVCQAFKERDDVAFYRAGESLIADELAANHHALAQDWSLDWTVRFDVGGSTLKFVLACQKAKNTQKYDRFLF
ncbi:MAG: hypothetical protein ACKO8H_10365 [Microcystis panniformis]